MIKMLTEIIVVKDKPDGWLGKISNKFKKFLVQTTGEGMIEILQRVTPKGETGNLRKGWVIAHEDDDEAIIQNIEEYAVFVDEGTGLYGKRKSYIVPRHYDYLSFEIRGEGVIFAKRTIGQPPQHYLRKATIQAKSKLKQFEKIAINHIE